MQTCHFTCPASTTNSTWSPGTAPTRKPTHLTKLWGLSGRTRAARPCGVWKNNQRDASLPKTRKDQKKKEFGSDKGLSRKARSQFGLRNWKILSWRGSRKHDEKPCEGLGSQGACPTSSICKRDQRRPEKPGQSRQKRNQKQNRDLELEPRDTSNCQEQLEVFPRLAAGWDKPPRAPQGAAEPGRVSELCSPRNPPLKPTAEPNCPAPGHRCCGIAPRWRAGRI